MIEMRNTDSGTFAFSKSLVLEVRMTSARAWIAAARCHRSSGSAGLQQRSIVEPGVDECGDRGVSARATP